MYDVYKMHNNKLCCDIDCPKQLDSTDLAIVHDGLDAFLHVVVGTALWLLQGLPRVLTGLYFVALRVGNVKDFYIFIFFFF